jgi:hypothetical protein
MNIRRYDRMPFYFAPVGTTVVSFEDDFIKKLDYMIDAHEEARNPGDKNRNFYERTNYVLRNYLRYQNDTLCNVMFDTQASRLQYARLNSTVAQGNLEFYLAAGSFHTLGFMYMSYFFRYRRLGIVPTLGVASAYYILFENVNNILYKVLVDRKVISEARRLGLGKHVQPVGTKVNRLVNFS